MLDLARVDDRNRLESSMWMESDSRPMSRFLRSYLPRGIVVEHEDGRRVSVDDAAFESVEANPYNGPRTVVSIDAGSNGQTTEQRSCCAGADETS